MRDDPTIGMNATAYVLLDCVDAPVIVVDPAGAVQHVSPGYERVFGVAGQAVKGASIAGLFDAGARERVLQALASVLGEGDAARFAIRVGDTGWAALLSPIGPPGGRSGAVLLLTEEPIEVPRIAALHRATLEPLEALQQTLEALLEQTGGRRAKRFSDLTEAGIRETARLRRTLDELGTALGGRGRTRAAGSFDVVDLLRHVLGMLARDAEVFGIDVQQALPPGELPVAGESEPIEDTLVHWLRARLACTPVLASLLVTAKRTELAGIPTGVVTIAESPIDPGSSAGAGVDTELERVNAAVHRIGGQLQTSLASGGQRLTTLRFPLA